MAIFEEMATLLKTVSRFDINIMNYTANNGQYLYLERKMILNMEAGIVVNKASN